MQTLGSAGQACDLRSCVSQNTPFTVQGDGVDPGPHLEIRKMEALSALVSSAYLATEIKNKDSMDSQSFFI